MLVLALLIVSVVSFVALFVYVSRRRDLPIGVCYQTNWCHEWRCDGQKAMRMHFHCVSCGQRAWFVLNYSNPQPPPFFDQSPRFRYSNDWSQDGDQRS
jgi:hypothetical protein